MTDVVSPGGGNRFRVKRVDTNRSSDGDGDDSEVTVAIEQCQTDCITIYFIWSSLQKGANSEAIEMGERPPSSASGGDAADRAASPTALLPSPGHTYMTVNESGASYKYTAKSLRHQLTREALPRLDNYRNILSISAGHRPTLEELHNNTIQEKVRYPLQRSARNAAVELRERRNPSLLLG